MEDDAAQARSPSLFLAELHKGHRDHNIHRPHQHQHALLHKRQTDGTTAVVEVIQTVSVVQQIEVDSDGNTVTTIVTAVPAADAAAATTTSVDAAAASTSATDGLASSTSESISDLSSSSTAVLTSTPSASIPTSSSFASFFVSSNSTTLIASSNTSSLTQSRFSNSSSTLSSPSLSSSALLTSSSTSSDDFATQWTSSTSLYTSSPTSTSTGINGLLAGAGGTEIASSSQASSTSSAGSGSGNDSSTTPATPVIIGSVVSSLAGAAFLIIVILFVWRWKKRSRNLLPLGSGGSISEGPESNSRAIEAPPGLPPQPSNSGMVERRSFAYAFPAALANLTGYKRFSQRTETGTISSTAGSERGFYRVSGRKLPSVWQHGGDGYGGGMDEAVTERHALSGASFYSDNQGFYGGFGGPALNKSARDSGVPVMRPSPARTPVTEQGPFGTPLTLPPITDLVGRSHPSRDGSHASKFTEEV